MALVTAPPFHGALDLTPLGSGRYAAEVGEAWTVGPKALGSILLVLAVRAAQERMRDDGAAVPPDPLVIGAEFLRASVVGPVELHTEVLKTGRTASVVAIRMRQYGAVVLSATVTTGRLPDDDARWADLPEMPAAPPADALDPAVGHSAPGIVPTLARSCDLRLDPASVAFVRGTAAPPVVRGWVRPHGEDPDVLFALLAGDILPPTVFNVAGQPGWAPTVQLTALLRARPVPGWLRLEARSTAVVGAWFDEDVTVIDAAGRLVCQARQLALAPLAPPDQPPARTTLL